MYSMCRVMHSNTSAALYEAPPPVARTSTLGLFCLASLMTWRQCCRVLLMVKQGRSSVMRPLRTFSSHCHPLISSALANLRSSIYRLRASASHSSHRLKRRLASANSLSSLLAMPTLRVCEHSHHREGQRERKEEREKQRHRIHPPALSLCAVRCCGGARLSFFVSDVLANRRIITA